MELFHILKSVIFHHPGGFRPHSPENNSSIFYLEFFRNRFKINRVGIKHGEGLARADSYTECSSPIQVLKLEENDLLENKNPSCFLMHSHQLRFALEESLHHIIGYVALHIFVTDKNVPHHSNRNLDILPWIALRWDNALHIERTILLSHLRNRILMTNQFHLNPGSGPDIGYGCGGNAAVPKVGINF